MTATTSRPLTLPIHAYVRVQNWPALSSSRKSIVTCNYSVHSIQIQRWNNPVFLLSSAMMLSIDVQRSFVHCMYQTFMSPGSLLGLKTQRPPWFFKLILNWTGRMVSFTAASMHCIGLWLYFQRVLIRKANGILTALGITFKDLNYTRHFQTDGLLANYYICNVELEIDGNSGSATFFPVW